MSARELWIVTGGSRGLGAHIVEGLVNLGHRVFDVSRTGKGENHIPLDLAHADEGARIIKDFFVHLDTHNQNGLPERVGFIHNAATLGPIGKIEDLNPEDLLSHFQVNVFSMYSMVGAFLQSTGKLGVPRVVVHVSSGAATRGMAGWGLYCGSKAAGDQIIRVLAQEYPGETSAPVVPFIFDPGMMDTQMQEQIRNVQPRDFPQVEQFREFHKTGKLQDPKVVAEKLLSLLRGDRGPLEPGGRYSSKDLP